MIVAFTSLYSGGATFMDWSWHWLKGNKKHWNFEEGWIPLVDDPIRPGSAHGHKKNHPGEIESWWKFLELAHNQLESPDTDITFYPFLSPIVEDTLKQYVENINLMAEKNISVVVIKKTKLTPYMSERSGIEKGYEMHTFLSNNPDIDQKLSIKKIREIASVRLIPQMTGWLRQTDKEYGSLNRSVLVLQDEEIMNHTESSMEKIFRHHNLKMDFSRLEHWRKIASDWRSKTIQGLEFSQRLPEICEAVIKGSQLNLDDYKIGFLEQSLMMAYLMKDHGRRLLLPDDNFPKNTSDLHRFLK
jgi:hypothetical protein